MATAVLDDTARQDIVTILQQHGVLRAGIFGSFARGSAGPESDLDLLIELPQGKTLFDLERLALDLEVALGRKVDLVTYRAFSPRLREKVLAEQVPIL
jgi:predicted nucleotidyltransferase